MTVSRIISRKNAEPIVCLTAYSAPIARLMDAHVDLILVGDSAAMVVHGLENTIAITLEAMIAHAQSVVRATSHALIVVDLPFGSYESSPEQAFATAVRVLKETGAAAIKLEGGQLMAPTVAFLTGRGIPVMGHIGLQPQAVHSKGYRAVGRNQAEWPRIKADAAALEAAGAFSIVLEAMVEPLAVEITELLKIPTIGIGASSACDGQILVVDDMLGLTSADRTPRFVKRFAELDAVIEQAVKAYAAEVRARAFPTSSHTISAASK